MATKDENKELAKEAVRSVSEPTAAPKPEPKTVAGHKIADVEAGLLQSGKIPHGVDYRPYETPQFAPSKKEDA